MNLKTSSSMRMVLALAACALATAAMASPAFATWDHPTPPGDGGGDYGSGQSAWQQASAVSNGECEPASAPEGYCSFTFASPSVVWAPQGLVCGFAADARVYADGDVKILSWQGSPGNNSLCYGFHLTGSQPGDAEPAYAFEDDSPYWPGQICEYTGGSEPEYWLRTWMDVTLGLSHAPGVAWLKFQGDPSEGLEMDSTIGSTGVTFKALGANAFVFADYLQLQGDDTGCPWPELDEE